ncbi:MAG: pilus assembly protein [Xanthobacteraceae bacterium]|nr:pilus assembly protein [Xanthobacteraceae bacterium]MCW5673550.1 pilus assembly protein [Xanthobacteraceae bacterium]
MFGITFRKEKASSATRGLRKLVVGFGRKNDGAAAVEFAIVVVPFFALLFAIIELAMVFWAGQVLETATHDASRLIMTGQAQAQNFDQTRFKQELCARALGLFSCDTFKIDVRSYGAFASANIGKPTYKQNGQVDDSNFTYQTGGPGDIVVVRVMYEWPLILRTFGLDLADTPAGKRLLMSAVAFRNEPYQ